MYRPFPVCATALTGGLKSHRASNYGARIIQYTDNNTGDINNCACYIAVRAALIFIVYIKKY